MNGRSHWFLGVVAFLPILAVVAFVVFLVVKGGSTANDDGLTFMLLVVVHWKHFAALFLLRIIIGTALAAHAWRNLDGQPSHRALWAVRLFFFTELRAPQYWLEHLR